jgi:hypothetical protein
MLEPAACGKSVVQVDGRRTSSLLVTDAGCAVGLTGEVLLSWDDKGCRSPHPLGRRGGSVIERIRRFGPWPGVIAALFVLCGDAYASPDRRGSLALNVGLAAGMALLLVWRRRSPLWSSMESKPPG